jgi:hypothetical protein
VPPEASPAQEEQANASPPITGIEYVDECFRIPFQEQEEERDWKTLPGLLEIPRLALSGEVEAAQAAIDRGLEAYPDLDFLYSWLGHLRGRAGDRDGQRQAYLEGLEKCRSKAGLCDGLGMLAFESDDLAEAVTWWVRSGVVQLTSGQMDSAQPFLRLATIADGLDLTACSTALMQQVDRIQNVRLNQQGQQETWGLALSQGDDAIKSALILLCRHFIGEEVEALPGAAEVKVTGNVDQRPDAAHFVGTFRKHVARMKNESPPLARFIEGVLPADRLEELGAIVEEEMRRTLEDGKEHGLCLTYLPLYLKISTLKGSIPQAGPYFESAYGGYTKCMDKTLNDPLFRESGCSVLCHLIYGVAGNEGWVHLSLVPVRQPAPIDNVMIPVEFLSAAERRKLGLPA